MIRLLNRLLNLSSGNNSAALTLQKASKPKVDTYNASLSATGAYPKEPQSASVGNRRKAKLVMVTAHNNNKFYDMEENDNGTFTVSYGRVGGHCTQREYPIHLWESKQREKINKGYTDTTYLFAEAQSLADFLEIDNAVVNKLVNELINFAKQSVYRNYNVSSEQVTLQQVKKAQSILDKLSKKINRRLDVESFNDQLMELYTIIPRRMAKVKEHLITAPRNKNELKEIEAKLAEEQATLDVMRGQVEMHDQQAEQQLKPKTLLEAFGLQIEPVKDKELIKNIKKMMGGKRSHFKRAFKVINLKTQKAFDEYVAKSADQTTQLFWHGSRNENWLSILKTGLVLRPANAIINGKMFGYGLYFADRFAKSLNYTSLTGSFWAGGRQTKGYLALFDTHVGKQLKIKRHAQWCCQLTDAELKKKGRQYNSVYAEGGVDLLNNEYIIYNQEQCTIRYIVQVG